MAHEVALGESRDELDPVGLRFVHVHLAGRDLHEPGEPLDRLAEGLTAHVVGVIVGHQRARDLEALPARRGEDAIDVPRGIDHEALPRVGVPDEVDEVGHRGGDVVPLREVAAGQQLSNDEPCHAASLTRP